MSLLCIFFICVVNLRGPSSSALRFEQVEQRLRVSALPHIFSATDKGKRKIPCLLFFYLTIRFANDHLRKEVSISVLVQASEVEKNKIRTWCK